MANAGLVLYNKYAGKAEISLGVDTISVVMSYLVEENRGGIKYCDMWEGDYVDYSENDTKCIRAHMHNGVLDGLYEVFRRGVLIYSCTYVMGKVEGMQRFYDDNGILYSEQTLVNDKTHGTKTVYYPNGKVKERSIYIRGKKKETEAFNEDGSRSMIWSF